MAKAQFVPPGFGRALLLSIWWTCACAAVALSFLELFPPDGKPLGLLSTRAAWVLLVVAVVALGVAAVKLVRIQLQRLASTQPPEEAPQGGSPLKTAAAVVTIVCMVLGYVPLFFKGAGVSVMPWLPEVSGWARYGVAVGFLILGFASKAVGDGRGTAIVKKDDPLLYWSRMGMFSLGSAVFAYMTT